MRKIIKVEVRENEGLACIRYMENDEKKVMFAATLETAAEKIGMDYSKVEEYLRNLITVKKYLSDKNYYVAKTNTSKINNLMNEEVIEVTKRSEFEQYYLKLQNGKTIFMEYVKSQKKFKLIPCCY